jgi:dihydroxycyclohexadiene carboxylate dehydrogenase
MNTRARFGGKSFVVTGAAQGIGRHVAIEAAAEGAQVTLVDRSQLVEEAAREITSAGGQADAVLADLETYAGNLQAMEQAKRRFGKIDVLITNVGGAIWMKPFEKFEEAQIEAEIRRSSDTMGMPGSSALHALSRSGHHCQCLVGRNTRH